MFTEPSLCAHRGARPGRYCWARAVERILCDLLRLWSVHSLGDTADSLFCEISFLTCYSKARCHWSQNRCEEGVGGVERGSILFLPFQIPVFNIAMWHPTLSPCWKEPSFSPLFNCIFLSPPLTTFSCLGWTHMLCVFACDQSARNGWVDISCS